MTQARLAEKKAFAQALRQFMRKHDYSLTDMAQYLGAPIVALSTWIRKPRVPKPPRLQEVLKRLQAPRPPSAEELRKKRIAERRCLRCNKPFLVHGPKVYCSEYCLDDQQAVALRLEKRKTASGMMIEKINDLIRRKDYKRVDIALWLKIDPAVLTRWLGGSTLPLLSSAEYVIKQLNKEPAPTPLKLKTAKYTCRKCGKVYLYHRKTKFCGECMPKRRPTEFCIAP